MPPTPWTASLTVPTPDADLVTELLFAAGAGAVEEVDPPQTWDPPRDTTTLRGWFPDHHADALAALLPTPPAHWEPVPPDAEDWRARHGPVDVAPGIVVAPPWDAPPGALLIDPGQGFGTARHPTTRGVLRALDRALTTHGPTETLDVGCGSGVLALWAAKRGAPARGLDTDPAAVADARHNAALNHLLADFAVRDPRDEPHGAPLVVCNVVADIHLQIAPAVARLTLHRLILGGVAPHRVDDVLARYAPLSLTRRDAADDWTVLELERAT